MRREISSMKDKLLYSLAILSLRAAERLGRSLLVGMLPLWIENKEPLNAIGHSCIG